MQTLANGHMAKHTNNDTPPIPQTDRDAIEFALNYVDPLQIADFLRDWLDGAALEGWLAVDRGKQDDVRDNAATRPRFGDHSISDAEMLALLKYPEIAMSFALDYLKPMQVQDFIRDWKSGADLVPWLQVWRQTPPAA